MEILGYKIKAKINDSQRSTIYLTESTDGKAGYLLKLAKHLPDDHKAALRFEQEFALTQSIQSPYVIQAFDLVRKDQQTAILFEHFDGLALDSSLIKHPYPIDTCFTIALQLAQALNEIHSAGITHKDLNPSNILWNPKTEQIKIIDFGISSLHHREQSDFDAAEKLEGTLAYLSPEQTGRMNRSVDHRTDFYSLGMTLFFLFTGHLPFQTEDMLEIIHYHIAGSTPDPTKFQPSLPEMVSTIIQKLLAKSADDRYQTAFGLLKDIEKCYNQYSKDKHIKPFPLAKFDISEQLQIPQKLYGRQSELQLLISSFERVSHGGIELVFVGGYSGVGKTSLVNEVHRPMTCRKGLFVSGKFDQYQRNTPYSALVSAFAQLIEQALFLPEDDLEQLKKQLKAELGNNAGVLATLIPELTKLIGKTTDGPALDQTEIQNTFNLLIKRFISVFARREHPLVVFIDDWQWADAASLQMLHAIFVDSGIGFFLLIAAYRDNEVDENHPLSLTKKQLEKDNAPSETLELQPISEQDVLHLVMDTFHVTSDQAESLVAVLMEKTLGNPFFINQLIVQFYDDGFIFYDKRHHGWNWDEEKLKQSNVGQNVADLLLRRMSLLPEEAKQLLMIASCIGPSVSLKRLSFVAGKNLSSVVKHVSSIIDRGLMVQLNHNDIFLQIPNVPKSNELHELYNDIQVKFLHDRVQQAAYLSIAETQRPNIHLEIGRKLKAHFDELGRLKHLFTIVAQFNAASMGKLTLDERLEMAELNLLAAQKAKATLAYESALDYVKAGKIMLGENPPQTHADIAFGLAFEGAECRYFIAELAKAEEEFNQLLEENLTTIQKAQIYRALVDLHTTKGEIEKAVKAAISGCSLLGVQLFLHPTRQQVLDVYDRIQQKLDGREIAQLADLPDMSDPEKAVALSILAAMMPPALFYDQNLLYLEHCLMVEISLSYGNAPPSAPGYSYFGMIIGCMLGEYQQGYEFGRLGYTLLNKKGYEKYRAKVCLSFGSNVNFWVNPVTSDLRYLEEGFKSAIESGDVTYSCYHCNHIVMVNLASGMNLDEAYEDAENRKKYVATTGYTEIVDIIESKQRLMQLLRGNTNGQDTYDSNDFSEREFEKHLESNMSITVCWYYIHKAQARYLFGDPEAAIRAAEIAQELLWSSIAHVEEPEYYLYYSLALAAVYDRRPENEKKEIIEKLQAHLSLFQTWADNCTDNFEHKYHLIQGEIFRLKGNDLAALQSWEKAIVSAQNSGFIHLQALAHELALRLCVQQKLTASAQTHLQHALNLYLRWKAIAKFDQLKAEFSELVSVSLPSWQAALTGGGTQNGATHTTTSGVSDLVDYKTIASISRAIATQIDLDQLLLEIMKYAIENTGADKASIILIDEGKMQLEVHSNGSTIKSGLTSAARNQKISDFVSEGIIRFVSRTEKSLIIDNAFSLGDFVSDTYVIAHRCKSILCMPFSYGQGRQRYLFLENSQMVAAFPQERIETLSLILPQIAIAIDNAKLFESLKSAHDELTHTNEELALHKEHLEKLVSERTDELQTSLEQLRLTQKQLLESEKMASLGGLVAGVAHELNTPTGTALMAISCSQSSIDALLERLELKDHGLTQKELTECLNESQEAAELIIKALKRIADLVKNFKQLAVDVTTEERRSFNLYEYIKTLSLSLTPDITRQGHHIEIKGENNLVIASYPGAISQIISTLITNSLTHAFSDGNKGRITIRLFSNDELVHLTYSDDGKGMDEQTAAKIFEPFFTTKRGSGSRGLGLHILYNQVTQALGGSISCTSEAGKGTTFKLSFPKDVGNS